MGGTCLKEVDIKRMSKEEYDEVVLQIEEAFSSLKNRDGSDKSPSGLHAILKDLVSYRIPQSYFSKESFGDVDVVYYTTRDTTEVVDKLAKIFQSTQIVRNGPVTSLDILSERGNRHQVDLIFSPSYNKLDFHYNYLCWNDMGNLIGRVARACGFKFAHNGLYYVMRAPENDNYVITELLLSTDFFEVLNFLGYGANTAKYREGFNDLSEIFEFVESSRYFSPSKYLYQNLNHVQRIRDKKRPTYQKFVEYVEEKYSNHTDPDIDKRLMLHRALIKFGKVDEYQSELFEHKIKNIIGKYFNAELVREKTGFEGKELGKAMKYIKSNYIIDLNSCDRLSKIINWDLVKHDVSNWKD